MQTRNFRFIGFDGLWLEFYGVPVTVIDNCWVPDSGVVGIQWELFLVGLTDRDRWFVRSAVARVEV